MTKKIAIPINEAGVLDAHFGHCKFFAFITVKNGNIKSEDKLVPPPHEPGVLPQWIAENGASDVICGGMGRKAIDILNNKQVNVFVGAPQEDTKTLVESFLNNTLTFTANYCNHKEGHTCDSH
ncbi:NifB/NifX family molybdenum-iron cluster-binding protein [Saccharicrinis aurantiacus]|uniref:NifB/NifX family molybdenum-iron cluster-binding protein n=1 Tax=Saccharicrinis aurantiacus TaxID=1849719 RepID=UPI002491DA80|nr:NifB/NifX family molybdenum-iron cluster-binding protein [Saccharicrinis aurantiacus]